jgi:hypothetical protein
LEEETNSSSAVDPAEALKNAYRQYFGGEFDIFFILVKLFPLRYIVVCKREKIATLSNKNKYETAQPAVICTCLPIFVKYYDDYRRLKFVLTYFLIRLKVNFLWNGIVLKECVKIVFAVGLNIIYRCMCKAFVFDWVKYSWKSFVFVIKKLF